MYSERRINAARSTITVKTTAHAFALHASQPERRVALTFQQDAKHRQKHFCAVEEALELAHQLINAAVQANRMNPAGVTIPASALAFAGLDSKPPVGRCGATHAGAICSLDADGHELHSGRDAIGQLRSWRDGQKSTIRSQKPRKQP